MYLDSRDLQERLKELESMQEAWQESQGLPMPEAPLDDDEARELAELRELANEVSEWDFGATLIPEDEFEDYARELAEDIGYLPRDAEWPLSFIDWTAAADALKVDYCEVVYNGITFLVRSY